MGKEKAYSDQEVINGIKQGGAIKQRFTNYLYKQYAGFVYNGVKKYHITLENAVDAYGDSIIGLCNRIENHHFQTEGNLSGYLYRSFCNRCVDRVRKKTSSIDEKIELMPNMSMESRNALTSLIEKEEVSKLRNLLDQLGGKCREILILSEYYGYSVEEITQKLGFKNPNSLSSQKYRCMSRLKAIISKRKRQQQ